MKEEKEKKTPKELYDGVAEYYAKEFIHIYYNDGIDDIGAIHNIDSYWIGDEPGGSLYINDNYYDYETIRYAVDNNVNPDNVFDWYDYCCSIWVVDRDIKTPSLKEWCNGYKRKSEEDIELLNRLKSEVLKAEQNLKEAIYEFKNK